MSFSNPSQLFLTLFLLLSSCNTVMAQKIAASNDPPPDNPDFDLSTGSQNMNHVYEMDYLTDRSGQIKITLEGSLVLTTPANINTLLGSDIAYISCDDGAYPGNVGPTQTFTAAYNHSPPPRSIILYSVNATRCILTPNDLTDTTVYSMKDSTSSTELLNFLQTSLDRGISTIKAHDNGGGGGGILGKSPTTAVAMIILYSITGIITALFLIIIIVGAIRAHRHPERYGPRNIVGRARQSRAKGIARAMLETIPIVKFGDNDARKTAEPATTHERDIEMASPRTVPEASAQAQQHPASATSAGPNEHMETNNGSVTTDPVAAEPTTSHLTDDLIANADNGLACSVCTDDFTKGQDVRVLPCNHKFHPECIDPWLLNVSGTCPMCRVDLRPTGSDEHPHPEDTTTTAAAQSQSRRNSEALASFNPATQQNQGRRNSRARPLHYLHHYLNRGRMEEATPQERLEALRRLRLVNRSDVDYAAGHQDGPNASGDATATGSGRSRLSARFSRAFGGDRSRPVSGVPSMPPPTPVVPEGREGTEGATGAGAGSADVPAVPTVPTDAGAGNTAREHTA
ncbi:MAG: hypothetical protein LQ349_008558 [Xanthoria aureola]|nr:MAG: hypothetical protein LQ349_008558 [Xanthoria aureola]